MKASEVQVQKTPNNVSANDVPGVPQEAAVGHQPTFMELMKMAAAREKKEIMTNPFLLRYWDHKELIRGEAESRTNTNSTKTLLEWARLYLSKGFSVIPLKPESSEPAIGNWTDYTKRHPTDQELCDWFQEGENNIGIVTGMISGINVALIESDLGGTVVERGEFPPTPTVEAGYGFHLYYKYCYLNDIFQKHHTIPDIDLLSNGHYVVAPPSYTPGVGSHSWFLDIDLETTPIADKPELLTRIREDDDLLISSYLKGASERRSKFILSILISKWALAGWSLEDCIALSLAWLGEQKHTTHPPEMKIFVTSVFIDAVTGRTGAEI